MSTGTKPEVARLPDAERALLEQALAAAQETGNKAIDFGAQRLRAVLTVGHTLNHWRVKVGSQQWYAWLDVNVFPMVETTVRSLTNWMRLAKAETEGKIKIAEGIGVRHAMMQCGLIPANDKGSDAQSKAKGSPAIILAIVRVAHMAARLVPRELDEQQRRTVTAALLVLVDLKQRVDALPLSSGSSAQTIAKASDSITEWQSASKRKETGTNGGKGTPPHKESL